MVKAARKRKALKLISKGHKLKGQRNPVHKRFDEYHKRQSNVEGWEIEELPKGLNFDEKGDFAINEFAKSHPSYNSTLDVLKNKDPKFVTSNFKLWSSNPLRYEFKGIDYDMAPASTSKVRLSDKPKRKKPKKDISKHLKKKSNLTKRAEEVIKRSKRTLSMKKQDNEARKKQLLKKRDKRMSKKTKADDREFVLEEMKPGDDFTLEEFDRGL